MPPLDPEDAAWFSAELQPHETALRGYLHKLAEPSAVDDIVQETYIRVLKARARSPIESPRGLLFAIARNVTRDLHRRRTTANTISLTEMAESHVFLDAADVGETVSRRQEEEILTAAIAALPPRCREVILLRKFENLSQREIADRLGISVHTVEAQLVRGMRHCHAYFVRSGALPRSNS